MYENEQELRLRVYTDDDWPQVRKKTLCSEKIEFAQTSFPIVFDYKGMERDDRPGKKKTDRVEIYTARVQRIINMPRARTVRNRYFYFIVDDCSLERSFRDSKIPDMFYKIQVMNGRGGKMDMTFEHLPADEEGIGFLLLLNLLLSGALTLLLFYRLASSIGGDVHVAVVIVMAACACNGLSALCELVHRQSFSSNGVGSFSADCLSSHFEALSDSMVSLILLSIGAGWTLPADVVGGGLGKDAVVGKLFQGVKNPAGSLLDLISSRGGSGDIKGGLVAFAIIAVHAGLAQWGRTFDDDFDTYHALEHPPGRALMMLRFALGLVFVTGVGTVRSGGRCPPSLMSFLTRFALVGLSYFASLPGVSMFIGSALPYHLRHQALHWGASMVQACSLLSLTWLFIGNENSSAYHRLSKVGKSKEGDMTADLSSQANIGSAGSARPTMWRFGKTKIRLD